MRLIFSAAYELWIGDFIWANEEKQRETIQSQRGGGMAYEPLYNTTTRREYYDRSVPAAPKDTRRRGSTGDSTRRLVSVQKDRVQKDSIHCITSHFAYICCHLSFTNSY